MSQLAHQSSIEYGSEGKETVLELEPPIKELPPKRIKPKVEKIEYQSKAEDKKKKFSKVQALRIDRIRELLKRGLAKNDIPLYKRAELRRESGEDPVH